MGHEDATRYVVYVMWLKGYTASTIAQWTRLSPKQISGIVTRSEYHNRARMTSNERHRYLSELKAIRLGTDGQSLDGGILDKLADWKPLPLHPTQTKGTKT